MRTSGRQLAIIAAVIVIAAALFIILPAFATSGDYGVNTGSLNDSQTQQSQNPTATPKHPADFNPAPAAARHARPAGNRNLRAQYRMRIAQQGQWLNRQRQKRGDQVDRPRA